MSCVGIMCNMSQLFGGEVIKNGDFGNGIIYMISKFLHEKSLGKTMSTTEHVDFVKSNGFFEEALWYAKGEDIFRPCSYEEFKNHLEITKKFMRESFIIKADIIRNFFNEFATDVDIVKEMDRINFLMKKEISRFHDYTFCAYNMDFKWSGEEYRKDAEAAFIEVLDWCTTYVKGMRMKQDELKKAELLRAIEKSNKTYEEIMAFLTDENQ